MDISFCAFPIFPGIDYAKALDRNFTIANSLPERTSTISLECSGPIAGCRTEFLFDYDIFPSTLMRAEAEWKSANREMEVGDVIIQRAIIPPIGFGICLEFAVRVSAIFREPNKIGFAYETLSGHMERGISEFFIEENQKGQIQFKIHTFSEPAHWLARLGRLLALPYQRWCTKQALKHVARRFQEEQESRN
jgi:uncharacterized protein (UPF0548 family)